MQRYIRAEFDANYDETRQILGGEGPLLVEMEHGQLLLQFALTDKPDNTITITVDLKELLHAIADVAFHSDN